VHEVAEEDVRFQCKLQSLGLQRSLLPYEPAGTVLCRSLKQPLLLDTATSEAVCHEEVGTCARVLLIALSKRSMQQGYLLYDLPRHSVFQDDAVFLFCRKGWEENPVPAVQLY
jgi:hypothetical protein